MSPQRDPGPDPGARVRLVEMTWDEFDVWSEQSVTGFAARLVAAGLMSRDEAHAYAREQLADLLPSGIATPLHLLRTVREDVPGEPVVGHLWLRVGPVADADGRAGEVQAYLFDIELVPAARGRGLGRAAMLAAEQLARGLDATVLRLNVFGQDVAALRLYEGLGYVASASMADARGLTAQSMTKAL